MICHFLVDFLLNDLTADQTLHLGLGDPISQRFYEMSDNLVSAGIQPVILRLQSLVDTYMVILSSRTTLDQIRSAAKLTYTDKQLTKMIRAQAVNGTEVFEITVASTDPQEARNIANTVTQVLPARIADVVEGSSVRVVDYAQLPTSKASPSIPCYTLLGMLTGLILSCAFFILRELFDNQIRSEDQLLQAYPQIPVLAVIPELLQQSNGHDDGYRQKEGSHQ